MKEFLYPIFSSNKSVTALQAGARTNDPYEVDATLLIVAKIVMVKTAEKNSFYSDLPSTWDYCFMRPFCLKVILTLAGELIPKGHYQQTIKVN
jgi:hypothetical protein